MRVRPKKQRRGGCCLNVLTFKLSGVPHLLLRHCCYFSGRQRQYGLCGTIRRQKLYLIGLTLRVYHHDGSLSTNSQAAFRMRLLQLDNV